MPVGWRARHLPILPRRPASRAAPSTGTSRTRAIVFAAMCDRVNLPVEALIAPERQALREIRSTASATSAPSCSQQTVVNPQWRRVFEIIFHKCEMVQDERRDLRAPAPVAQGRAGQDARAPARGRGMRPAAGGPRHPAGRQCLPRVDWRRAGALAVLARGFRTQQRSGAAGRRHDRHAAFSTALRKGYVPRPMAPIDAEMATLCGSSTRRPWPTESPPLRYPPLSPQCLAPARQERPLAQGVLRGRQAGAHADRLERVAQPLAPASQAV